MLGFMNHFFDIMHVKYCIYLCTARYSMYSTTGSTVCTVFWYQYSLGGFKNRCVIKKNPYMMFIFRCSICFFTVFMMISLVF